MTLEPRDALGFIESESEAAAATIAPASLDVRVPSCPDWSFAELIWHLGRVQRFWASAMRAGDVDPEFPTEAPGPSQADELGAWFRASTRELLDALRELPWDAPAWVWWKDDRTVGAIARHQVQEAAVHRWDAQHAVGSVDPLPTPVAVDGVDEFLWITRQLRGPEPIAFHATDTGDTFAAGPGAPLATASASASDLVLLLYGRVNADEVAVAGDRTKLDAFLIPIG
jgi:uncharacterized protein (TIGR03083 family)